jgi:hypothetical protein
MYRYILVYVGLYRYHTIAWYIPVHTGTYWYELGTYHWSGFQMESPDGAASPRRRRLRAGQWELFIFFARPARSALLISGRRRTSIMISRSPIISIFSPQSSSRSHSVIAVRLHDLHCPPSAVPAFVPLHFAARIFLLWLQQVA